MASSPSIRTVGEPKKRSSSACSSLTISRVSTRSGSRPSSLRTRFRSSSASGYDGQPSHQRSSTLIDLDLLDDHRLGRPVLRSRLHSLDRVDGVHAVGHPAEDGVLAVEPRGLLGGDDEELAAVGVRAAVGHRERAANDLVLVDLVLELVARAARARALGAAALDHEVLDHPMEDQAVVVAVARELHEVLDGLGGVLVEQLHDHLAVVGVQGRLAHLRFATSTRSSRPRTRLPSTFSATSRARSSGTSTKLKRSSTRAFRTSSFSRCVLSTTAPTTSAGSKPSLRPPPTKSLTYGTPSRLCGLVCRGRRVSRSTRLRRGRSPLADHSSMSILAWRSMASSSRRCFGVISVIARPASPARPVRPMRCT